MVTVVSSSSKVASVPLKSKRCPSSRIAWSTAFVNSWVSISETTSKEGMSGLREQLIQRGLHLVLELRVVISGGRAGKAGMDLAHVAPAVDENRGGKGVHALQHRQLFCGLILVRNAGDQRGVFDGVMLPKS